MYRALRLPHMRFVSISLIREREVLCFMDVLGEVGCLTAKVLPIVITDCAFDYLPI